MDIAIPYTATGRTRQKNRTRQALIEAARALIAAGTAPTVEEAAAAASISRTTAYRYFRDQRELLVAAHPEIQAHSLLGESPPDDVAQRLDIVLNEILRITLESESALRTMLRLSLEPGRVDKQELLLRRGRAIQWLRDALEPLRGRLSDHEFDRLVYAIRSSAGIESLVWLCDVAGLSREAAIDVMKWSAGVLFQSALSSAE
jgi:AcrR family transcriptional regulator